MPTKRVPLLLRFKGEKKRFHLPFEKEGRELLMVSSHPTKKDHVLVWRKSKEALELMDWHHVSAYEAKLTEKGIQEEPKRVVGVIGDKEIPGPGSENAFDVFHINVEPRLRGKGLGTAAREHMISMGKQLDSEKFFFPRTEGHPREFYKQRGFDEGHEASMEDLNYSKRKGLVNLSKKLEEKGFKVLWAKHRKYKD